MLIFISGSINSGKTTIAKILSNKIPNCAIVEIDLFSGFIEWLPIDKKIKFNLENATLIINNFLANGFNVVVPYPLSKGNYDYLLEQINIDEENVFTFILNPDLNVVLSNRGSRELDEWEMERIKYHYEKKINNPGFGLVINNSLIGSEETAKLIFKNLSK